MKINEIKNLLQSEKVSSEILQELEKDDRIGVKKLLASYYKKKDKEQQLVKKYKKLQKFEEKYFSKGYKIICGVDEVGRGPLAGPLVVAAVILKKDSYFAGLTDSKKLSKKKREELYDQIIAEAISYVIVEITPAQIARYNIYRATQIGMFAAVKQLSVKPSLALIDAMPVEELDIPSVSIIKGDAKSVSIAAASVLAKVYRDRIMEDYAKIYPGYDFENNMGYGTEKHLAGLKKLGICPIHRLDFEPIKSMIEKQIK